MRGEAVMKEATSIKALIHLILMVVCVLRVCVCVHGDEWCNGVGVHRVRGVEC